MRTADAPLSFQDPTEWLTSQLADMADMLGGEVGQLLAAVDARIAAVADLRSEVALLRAISKGDVRPIHARNVA